MAECDDGVEFCIEEGGELLILKALEAEWLYCTAIKQKASLRVALTRQSPFAFPKSVRLGCGSNEFEISRAVRLCSKTLYAKIIVVLRWIWDLSNTLGWIFLGNIRRFMFLQRRLPHLWLKAQPFMYIPVHAYSFTDSRGVRNQHFAYWTVRKLFSMYLLRTTPSHHSVSRVHELSQKRCTILRRHTRYPKPVVSLPN